MEQEKPDKKIEAIKKDLAIVKQLPSLAPITSQEGVVQATEDLVKIKARINRIDEIRQTYVRPLNALVKDYNNRFNPFIDELELVEKTIKKNMGVYTLEQTRKQRAEEARLQAIHDKQMAKEQKKAEAKGLDFVPTDAPHVESQVGIVKVEQGKAVNSLFWNFEIVEPDKVPRKYCKPVEAMVRAAVASGERKIDGVRVFEDVRVSVGGTR